jgi:FkbM family methyltransferase
MKDFLKRAVKKAGFTISRAPDLNDFLTSRDVDLVFDVGANIGQFARSLRSSGYTGKLISFEPIKAAFSELSRTMSKGSDWIGHNCALGAQSGRTTINISENTVFSSLMPLSPYAAKFDPASQVVRTEEIEVRTLDEFLGDTNGATAFVKIDTQGFEREVIKGATRMLDRVTGLQLELPIQHLYDGGWTLVDALTTLDNLGFVPAQMRPATVMNDDRSSWAEIDCIFRRK